MYDRETVTGRKEPWRVIIGHRRSVFCARKNGHLAIHDDGPFSGRYNSIAYFTKDKSWFIRYTRKQLKVRIKVVSRKLLKVNLSQKNPSFALLSLKVKDVSYFIPKHPSKSTTQNVFANDP